ncbi:hypothetical protein AQUCO_01400321v1 [Aquilegia coerulea]|uniref:Ribonuclease H1 N-terminal domain-containing protein n=1 Tax=Aquilegia coerulea TaxID=218851 RepID=A0A2G5DVZ1_AQUCA|nr:hypothetical protein AQUCO_01400321v1 [Aquilegia coerulea]
MSQEKKYAVHDGRKPGLYDTWPEAKAQVEGYLGNCHEKVQPSGEPFTKPYVVKDGREPGVYDSWRDTHQQVVGYPGASYEKANSFHDAYERFSGNQQVEKDESLPEKEVYYLNEDYSKYYGDASQKPADYNIEYGNQNHTNNYEGGHDH